jgi:hypothetical protein
MAKIECCCRTQMNYEFAAALCRDAFAAQYWIDSKNLIKTTTNTHHNIYGPAIVLCDPLKVEYRIHGLRHNKSNPAMKLYNSDGTIIMIEYYVDGQLHNDHGPASIHYYKKGRIYQYTWYSYGKLHRLNEPAVITYNSDGTLYSISHWNQGKRHNTLGPAVKYFQSGNTNVYYLWNKQYTYERWLKLKSEPYTNEP